MSPSLGGLVICMMGKSFHCSYSSCVIDIDPYEKNNFPILCQKSNIINNAKEIYFVIPETTRKFIDGLIDYYISEAASYKQIAKTYHDEVEDVNANTFGIIVGCVYSGFLQAYQNQKQHPSLEDTQEFTHMIKLRAAQIKRNILDAKV